MSEINNKNYVKPEIKVFAEKLLAKALKSGFADAEINYGSNKSFSVQTLDGEIDEYKNNYTEGVSFRGTFNGKMGYSYSELIDESAIDIIIKEASENSQIIEEEEQDKLFADFKTQNYQEIEKFSEELAKISIEDKIAAALLQEKTAKNTDSLIKAVDYNGVSAGEGASLLMNTYGLKLESRSNSANAYAYTRAVKENENGNDETKTGGEFWGGQKWDEYNPEEVGKEAAEEAVKKFGAKPVKSGVYRVAFKNLAFQDLISTFSSVILADKAQKGLSLLAGKLGEKIASDIFTLRDDPIFPQDPTRSSTYDAEGVATYNKAVIENGVFKTFLHNCKTAAKDGVKSTGNASGNYKSPVKVSPMNLYVEQGKLSLDEMIAKVGDGLYITDLAGLHSGANAVSGDFSLLAEGFTVEGGKIAKPVEQITVAGNFFELLKNIEAVSVNLRHDRPAVLVNEINVAGE